MTGQLRSFELEAAILGAAALARAEQLLPGLPSLPELPALPDPRPALFRGVDHVRGLFLRRPDGLFVPCAPALVRPSAAAPAESGAVAHRPRPGEWSDAIDLGGMIRFLHREHGPKAAEHVAARTGEPLTTVRKWFRLETKPGFRATLVLVCVYGPPLLEAALARQPAWFAEIRAGADRLRLAGELAALRGQIDRVLGPGGAR